MTADAAATAGGAVAGGGGQVMAPAEIPMSAGSPSARRFAGRICVVTGAGSGIGRAVALRLAAEGGEVIAADSDAGAAAQTVTLAGSGRAAEVDVRSEESVARLAELAAGGGRVDLLVNNAGIEILGDITETEPAVWDEIFAVNLRGTFLVCRALLPLLPRRPGGLGGAIVNNASLMGLVSSRGLDAYCASKAGVVSLTRSMALDLADSGIRVNCVCPGIVHTSMLERRFALATDRDAAYRNALATPPVGYIGRAEDIAAAVAYLGSAEARFVTGAALVIDGGVAAQ
jgi:NAD(P)-dependent dehydrogenase (short-subunit alcohol dehydrogenase family)